MLWSPAWATGWLWENGRRVNCVGGGEGKTWDHARTGGTPFPCLLCRVWGTPHHPAFCLSHPEALWPSCPFTPPKKVPRSRLFLYFVLTQWCRQGQGSLEAGAGWPQEQEGQAVAAAEPAPSAYPWPGVTRSSRQMLGHQLRAPTPSPFHPPPPGWKILRGSGLSHQGPKHPATCMEANRAEKGEGIREAVRSGGRQVGDPHRGFRRCGATAPGERQNWSQRGPWSQREGRERNRGSGSASAHGGEGEGKIRQDGAETLTPPGSSCDWGAPAGGGAVQRGAEEDITKTPFPEGARPPTRISGTCGWRLGWPERGGCFDNLK